MAREQRQPMFPELGVGAGAGSGGAGAGSGGANAGGDEALRLAFAGLFAAMKNRPHMRAIILCPITQLAQVSRFFDIRRRRGSLGRL